MLGNRSLTLNVRKTDVFSRISRRMVVGAGAGAMVFLAPGAAFASGAGRDYAYRQSFWCGAAFDIPNSGIFVAALICVALFAVISVARYLAHGERRLLRPMLVSVATSVLVGSVWFAAVLVSSLSCRL